MIGVVGVIITTKLAEAVYMYFGMLFLLFGFCCIFCLINVRRQTPKKMGREAMEFSAARKLREAQQSQKR